MQLFPLNGIKSVENRVFIPLFMLGYLLSLLVGWAVLMLPSSQTSPLALIDTLFTAAAAISTAGLATLDLGAVFTFQGQLAIGLLVQLGGVGYMVLSAFIFLHHRQIAAVDLVKQALIYALCLELIGWQLLYLFFYESGVEDALWQSLFHAVAAFCTTGLSLFSTSFERFNGHTGVNIVSCALSLFGAFGFLLWMDCIAKLRGKKEPLRVIARMLFSVMAILLVLCTLIFFLLLLVKGQNHLLASFFQITSALTTSGFNTLALNELPQASLFLLLLLMFFGAYFTSRIAMRHELSLRTLFRQCKKMVASGKYKRALPLLAHKMRRVSAPFFRYIVVTLLFTFFLGLYEKIPLFDLLFELASATTNVGLSTGATPQFTLAGKSCIIFLMLMGRKGILLFGYLKSHASQQVRTENVKMKVF